MGVTGLHDSHTRVLAFITVLLWRAYLSVNGPPCKVLWAVLWKSCLRWLPRDFTKVTIRIGMGYKRNSSSLVFLSLFLRFTSKVNNINCHGNRVCKEWQIFSSILSLFFNISIFPPWNFFKLSNLVKMIWTNISQVNKYGVVQTVLPISRDFLFLAIKRNCCDRFSSNTDISKIAFVSQNVQSFQKIYPRKRQKIHC